MMQPSFKAFVGAKMIDKKRSVAKSTSVAHQAGGSNGSAKDAIAQGADSTISGILSDSGFIYLEWTSG